VPLVFSEREYTLEHPRPGWAEQDPDEWWFEIGLRWEDFEATYSRARMIRKRYTVLDLAFETGILEECVGELFAPDGFWGRAAGSQTRADGTRLVVREKHDDR
jgi:hypothetical protein